MKLLKILATSAVALPLLALISCGSKADKKAEEKKDTTATVPVVETPPAPVKPGDEMLIQHKVANYAKWKKEFESHDSVRASFGLSKFVVGRGMDDSNMLVV